MKRYDTNPNKEYTVVFEHPEGEFVRFSDLKAGPYTSYIRERNLHNQTKDKLKKAEDALWLAQQDNAMLQGRMS